jgi:hypothetical protein
MAEKQARSPCFMRSDIYEELRAFAETNGLKVYTLTNMLVENGLKMLREGITPSEVLIAFKSLEAVMQFVEVRPKSSWADLGKSVGTILKGAFSGRELEVAVMKAIDIVALGRASRSGSKASAQYVFYKEEEASDFLDFASAVVETSGVNLSVEKVLNMVRVSSIE